MLKEQKKFFVAASDLIMEAQYLSSLNHENILKVRGWSATGIEAYSKGGHDDYFLILDRLDDTLDMKLNTWKKKADAVIDYDKMCGKNMHNKNNVLTRTRVARQVASALEYLHTNN